MIGLVRLALRRPYTMAIAGLLIMLGGFLAVTRMVVDIFPNIDIPVVYVAWNYPGLSAEDMERRVVLVSERAYSTTVNGIERIESFSIPGLGILKVYFNQGTDIGGAIAQINAQNNSILRIAPPGITPPNMIRFNASNVPVVQVTLNSKSMPEQQIFDYGLNFLRIRLFTIPGVSIPAPYGGKQRQVIVDVDPARLSSKGLSQMDVVGALQTTNVIVPAGIARIGEREFNVKLNSSPQLIEQFQTLPVGVRDGLMVTLGDVAKVSDSFATQQNAVRINGQRASYMNILKNSDASTLQVVEAVRNLLPDIQATAPEGLELKLDFDQSVFVRGAIENIVHEAILSSILVSLMILVFLGSWRNTVIVSLSIPLSIAAGLAGLFLAGQTINLMTLGGLALAIGLLVDNATVTIENIHRNQGLGQAADGRDPRRLERGDPAADGRYACDLHRILPGAAADRAVAVSVHPARDHGRAGDAGVLRAVVHGRAGAGASSAQGPRPRRPQETGRGRAHGGGLRPRLRPVPRRLWVGAGNRPCRGASSCCRASRCWWQSRARWRPRSAPTSSRSPTSAS